MTALCAMVLLLVVSGCMVSDTDIEAAHQALVDESSPIGKKWVKLGGAAVVGKSTSEVQTTPNDLAQFQLFANGVIIYSNDYGAVYLTHELFDNWISLTTRTTEAGESLFDYIGVPTSDYTSTASSDYGSTASQELGRFQRGMIVMESGQPARIISGPIYMRYFDLADVMGLPRSEETASVAGGRFQRFQFGEIHWKDGVGTYGVTGAILDRWNAMGGPEGYLGFPKSDPTPLFSDNGAVIGESNRFQNGVIYSSTTTGAWEITGDFLAAYETRFGGPAGWLGLPVGAEGVAGSGDPFIDFEHGVLVDHIPTDSYHGIHAFGRLDFHVQRLQAYGHDHGIGNNDLYVYIDVDTPEGNVVHVRRPESGDYGSGEDLYEAWDLTDTVSSDFWVNARIDAWDQDGHFNDDDHLGLLTHYYSIDNLWGLTDSIEHRSGRAGGWFNVRNHHPYDIDDFRGQMWWSFPNFSTSKLSYHQFAQTFSDVDPDEYRWLNPFNALFYEVYQDWAKPGNCFGMGLESVYAQTGRSAYAEPIHRYWPDSGLRNEINVKHGYQLGATSINWFLKTFVSGATHDPVSNFVNSQLYFEKGDYTLISIFDDYWFDNGHTVRPYKWKKNEQCLNGSPGCWRIYVADPNCPKNENQASSSEGCDDFIEINPNTNTFSYHSKDLPPYSGGEWHGGRMLFHPYSTLAHTPRTPFWEVFTAITSGFLVIVGSNGHTNQISDSAGRTFFEPGLSDSPTRWDQIRQDPSSRVPNLAPLVRTNAGGGAMPLQIFFGEGTGMTHHYDIALAPGVTAGTTVEFVFQSSTLAAHVAIPGTPGKPDRVTAKKIGTNDKAVSVSVPADSIPKEIAWTVAGTEKQRWAELTALTIEPSQVVSIHLENAGYKLVFDNDGPPTTAQFRVKAGPDAPAVTVGTITIPSGTGTSFQFDVPVTTLTLSGQMPGNDGWLLAPVTVTLEAKDFSGTGIHAIEYSRDQENWTEYTAPFVYADEGATTLNYRARDNAGNQEPAKNENIKIDTRRPEVTVSTDQTTYTRVQPLVIHSSATDPAPGSGLEGVIADLDGMPVNDGQTIDLLWYTLGTHIVSTTAEDVAGWTTSKSASFEIVATLGSLRDLIEDLRRRGEIERDGVARSLIAKIEATTASSERGNRTAALRQLQALLSELNSQSGKHITAPAAELVASDVRYVMEHLP